MSRDVICPSCGFRNPPGLDRCNSCNFPFERARDADTEDEPTRSEESSAAGVPTYAARREPRRPHRRAAPPQGQAMWLWLLFGTFAAALLIWTAIDANRKRNIVAPSVEGSSQEQQKMADAARAAIAADSTNIEAHTALGNVLYDTGNWTEAISHYRVVLRGDSTRVAPMVDMGVCYYNLGETKLAEEYFRRAISFDPHQPIALFNLGIVSERHGDTEEALKYYHRALEHAPNEELKNAIFAAVQRTSQKVGKSPPPLPPAGGAPGGK